MKPSFLCPFIIIILCVTTVQLLLVSGFLTFHGLMAEEPAAKLRFNRANEQPYEAV
jgi:hypothetical protein